jgi:hypothetical protein
MIELKQIQNWVDTFYAGSTTQGKVEVRAFNDKFTLCYIKGSTGYTTRMGGSVYSASEWFVVETLAKTERGVFGSVPKQLFRIDGRLTKEHKEKLKQEYNLTLIEQPKKDKVVNEPDIYIIALDNDAFWGASYSGTLMCYKLVKEEENAYITYSKGQDKNVRINKNKNFTVKVKEAEKDAKLKEISEWIGQYVQLASTLYQTKQEIIKHFDK